MENKVHAAIYGLNTYEYKIITYSKDDKCLYIFKRSEQTKEDTPKTGAQLQDLFMNNSKEEVLKLLK